jgi:hypothetical protein
MITMKAVEQAAKLCTRRQAIAGACRQQVQNIAPADDEWLSAIEAFRKRELDEIDAELRALGVNPQQEEEAAA